MSTQLRERRGGGSGGGDSTGTGPRLTGSVPRGSGHAYSSSADTGGGLSLDMGSAASPPASPQVVPQPHGAAPDAHSQSVSRMFVNVASEDNGAGPPSGLRSAKDMRGHRFDSRPSPGGTSGRSTPAHGRFKSASRGHDAARYGADGPVRGCGERLRHYTRRGVRPVSLFWAEKVALLLDFTQVYALLWAMAMPWPWPPLWRKWSAWTLYINFDIVSVTQHLTSLQVLAEGTPSDLRSPYGQWIGYWVIAVVWLAVLFALLVFYRLYLWRLRSRLDDWAHTRATMRDALLCLAFVIYMPAGMALVRMFTCVSGEASARGSPHPHLDVDPEMRCWTLEHWILFTVSLIAALALLVGFPVALTRHIKGSLVHTTPRLHERYVRWKEAEYEHGVSQEWRTDHMWLFSSFNRRGVYLRPARLLWMTALLLFYIPHGGKDVQKVAADAHFVLFMAWAVYHMLFPSYRLKTSNRLSGLANWVLTANGFGGSLRAHRVDSPFVVDSTFVKIMLGFNSITLFICILMLFVMWRSRERWPAPPWAHALYMAKLRRPDVDAAGGSAARGAAGGAAAANEVVSIGQGGGDGERDALLGNGGPTRRGGGPHGTRVAPEPIPASRGASFGRGRGVGQSGSDSQAWTRVNASSTVPDKRLLAAGSMRTNGVKDSSGDITGFLEGRAPGQRAPRWSTMSSQYGDAADRASDPVTGDVDLEDLEGLAALESEWVTDIKAARGAIEAVQHAAPQLVHVEVLDTRAWALRESWRTARQAKHLLSWSLREVMEDVCALADACRPLTLLPNPVLEAALLGLAARMRTRADQLVLISAKKRRILFRLLAVRAWMGTRRFAVMTIEEAEGYATREEALWADVLAKKTEEGTLGWNGRLTEDGVPYGGDGLAAALVKGTAAPPPVGRVMIMTGHDLLRATPAILRGVRSHAAVRSAAKPRKRRGSRVGEGGEGGEDGDGDAEADDGDDDDADDSDDDVQRITPERMQLLMATRDRWRRLLTEWEKDFADRHGGREATESERREIVGWYLSYRHVNSALEAAAVEDAETNVQSNQFSLIR